MKFFKKVGRYCERTAKQAAYVAKNVTHTIWLPSDKRNEEFRRQKEEIDKLRSCEDG